MSYWIVTDAACDLPQTYVEKQEKFMVIPMYYQIDGKDHLCSPGGPDTWHAFYDGLRQGYSATTAQVSTAEYMKIFRQLTANGDEVLCIVFSSGLSGTFQAAVLAQQMLAEEKPEAKVKVVDSLCASAGQGLLVHYALQNRANGLSLEDAAAWIENNRQRLNHWFTVDDLKFLHRGGRLSATAAYLGSMLKIKPVLHVNEEGKLIPREKMQGRKRSLKALAQKVVELANPKENQTIFISHGDCEDDARYTLKCLEELGFKPKDVLITPISAIIGAHSGPGTVAIFFMADQR